MSHSKDGLWVNYSITVGERSPYAAGLLGHMRHWLSKDPEIKKRLDRVNETQREDIC